MENEIWKPLTEIYRNGKVLKFEGYEVSNLGRVRTYKQKYGQVSRSSIAAGLNRPLKKIPTIIKGRPDQKGYMLLCLSDINKKRHNIRIHTTVMQAFHGFPKDNQVICHYNDIKTDNRLSNLRYDTQKANMEDKIKNKKNQIY